MMRVLRENVEFPSLSPDGKRLAFKKRVNTSPVEWQLAVLDLASLQDTLLLDTRGVDDQPEWLDESHILYAVPSVRTPGSLTIDIWVATIDAAEPPRIFLPDALSPSIVR